MGGNIIEKDFTYEIHEWRRQSIIINYFATNIHPPGQVFHQQNVLSLDFVDVDLLQ